jgi:hypothetical protein
MDKETTRFCIIFPYGMSIIILGFIPIFILSKIVNSFIIIKPENIKNYCEMTPFEIY